MILTDRIDFSVDHSDMLGWLADYPAQLRNLYPAGRRAGEAAAGRGPAGAVGRAGGPRRLASCLVLGTGGGSAAAAYVAASLSRPRLGVPFTVAQGYDLPAFAAGGGAGAPAEVGAVGPDGAQASSPGLLVLAISHSGDTEETVSSFSQLPELRAAVVISGGGRLTARARELDLPLVGLPTGMQARAVFPGILAAVLGVLDGAGLTAVPFGVEIEETAALAGELARTWGPRAEATSTAPLDLARRARDRLLLIYGGPGATEGVARRWKNQLAECGKTLAHWYTVPEAHHDEVVGWDAPAGIREHLFAVLLRDPESESPRMAKRMDVTRRLLAEKVLGPDRVAEIAARGRSPLARAVSLCLYGDYLACYVALLRGLDPTPVPVIVSLKEEMARG